MLVSISRERNVNLVWQPAGTRGPGVADLLDQQAHTLAKLADLNQRLTRLVAEVTELNAKVVDIQRQLDGNDPR